MTSRLAVPLPVPVVWCKFGYRLVVEQVGVVILQGSKSVCGLDANGPKNLLNLGSIKRR